MEMLHLALLFLAGNILRNIPQIAALEQVSCNKTQYLKEELNKCCALCPPGYYRKETCTLSTETLCRPCEEKTFTTNWNYLNRCKTCYPCSISLDEKEPCSPTHDTVCVCPEGETCEMYDAIGVCQFCVPTMTPEPLMQTTPAPAESPPDMKIIGIILGVALFIVTIIMVVICIKTSLLKRLGRMIKLKRSPEISFPQAETTDGILESSLLDETPQQEQGKSLCYPIQETDATQPGEITLLSK
ncbi:tumor necrosis factor receptor superfamily member 3 [Anomaloglossus baeobatrachus]|uniref:tumor necrosis factor receptor superfamily member 3 n=1 Tax=Anomaloglossus baeobatrachus TaxID=238106 RepID=UPI003F4F61B5